MKRVIFNVFLMKRVVVLLSLVLITINFTNATDSLRLELGANKHRSQSVDTFPVKNNLATSEMTFEKESGAVSSMINYQEQKNHRHEFWGISIDVLFTVFITLLVLFLGKLIDEMRDEKRIKREMNNNRIAFFHGADSAIKGIHRNILNLKKYVENIKESEGFNPPLLNYGLTNIDSLNNFSWKESVDMFCIHSKKNKDAKSVVYLVQLYNSKKFLSKSDEMIFDNLDKHKEFSDKFINDYNKLYCQFLDYTENEGIRIRENNNIPEAHENLFNEILRILKEYDSIMGSSVEGKEAHIANKHFIAPLRAKLLDHGETIGISSDSQPIYNILFQMIILFKQWDANQNGFVNIFEMRIKSLEEACKSLKESVSWFKDEKNK